MGNFKDDFIKMPPGPAREEFVYNAAIKQGPPKNMVPVTVDAPGGVKVTYNVLSDYLTVDGLRVPLSPVTAQRIANHFNMSLPTQKMSKDIYNAADTKVRANPLSGTGYTGVDGKRYSAEDVIKNRIGASDAAIYYSKLTDQEVAKAGKNPGLIAGHGKDILEPIDNPNDVSMGGWQGNDKNPIQPYTAAHKGEAEHHTEYALYTRLIGNNVTITAPNGKVIHTTMNKLRASPTLSQAVATSSAVKQYGVPKNDLASPPPGYKRVKSVSPEVQQIAKSLLNGNFGQSTLFTHDGISYIGRVEQHFHSPDYKGTGPKGYHKGVTVYQADKLNTKPLQAPSTEVAKLQQKSPSVRTKLLQRIEDFLSKIT
jgi:hypothetical protein